MTACGASRAPVGGERTRGPGTPQASPGDPAGPGKGAVEGLGRWLCRQEHQGVRRAGSGRRGPARACKAPGAGASGGSGTRGRLLCAQTSHPIIVLSPTRKHGPVSEFTQWPFLAPCRLPGAAAGHLPREAAAVPGWA